MLNYVDMHDVKLCMGVHNKLTYYLLCFCYDVGLIFKFCYIVVSAAIP